MVTGDDAMDIIFKTTFSVYIIAVFEKKYGLDILKSLVFIYNTKVGYCNIHDSHRYPTLFET